MSIRPVRALLVDADGVTQVGTRDWAADMAAMLAHVDPARHDEFVRDVQEADESVLTGESDFAPRLQEVLDRWDVTEPVERVLALWQEVRVDEDVLFAIRGVGADGVRCVMASNQHNERARFMRDSLGYERTYERLFISCEMGLRKPDPAYFLRIVRSLGVAPAEALFVDDMAVNVAGAREAGLRAEVFAHGGGLPELQRILGQHGLG